MYPLSLEPKRGLEREKFKFCVANKKQKLNISTNQNTFRNRQQNNSACFGWGV